MAAPLTRATLFLRALATVCVLASFTPALKCRPELSTCSNSGSHWIIYPLPDRHAQASLDQDPLDEPSVLLPARAFLSSEKKAPCSGSVSTMEDKPRCSQQAKDSPIARPQARGLRISATKNSQKRVWARSPAERTSAGTWALRRSSPGVPPRAPNYWRQTP